LILRVCEYSQRLTSRKRKRGEERLRTGSELKMPGGKAIKTANFYGVNGAGSGDIGRTHNCFSWLNNSLPIRK
jgi:hypothetical protein